MNTQITGGKCLVVQALEDGVKKSVEMAVVVAVIGYPATLIFLASAAVFAGSLIFKILKSLV